MRTWTRTALALPLAARLSLQVAAAMSKEVAVIPRKPQPTFARMSLAFVTLFTVAITFGGAPPLFAAQKPASRAHVALTAIGAENEYADVIRQIGGQYVAVSSIINKPNTDPHTYQASTGDAIAISHARLIVQNGLGYDSFMNSLEAASPYRGRIVITVAKALGYGTHVVNPHLWYGPTTMSRIATVIAQDLGKLDPSHATYFLGQAEKFRASLHPWTQARDRLHHAFARTPVAVTEPVADDLLTACGLQIRTPWPFQAAMMNGIDPSPQAVGIEDHLLTQRRVKVLVYNEQTVSSTTLNLVNLAREHHIPTVAVYETMPSGMSYQTWMVEETDALYRALKDGRSTTALR